MDGKNTVKNKSFGPNSLIPKDINLGIRYHPPHTSVAKEKIKTKVKEALRGPKRRKHLQALKKVKLTSAYKNSMKLAGLKRKNNIEWRSKQQAGVKALHNDTERKTEYKKKQLKGNAAKLQDPKYWQAYREGIARREADKSYHQGRIAASNAKICRKVRTPLGTFDSITAGATAHKMNIETLRCRIKSKNFPDYQYV